MDKANITLQIQVPPLDGWRTRPTREEGPEVWERAVRERASPRRALPARKWTQNANLSCVSNILVSFYATLRVPIHQLQALL